MSDRNFRLRPGLRQEEIRYRFRVARTTNAYLRAGVAGAYLPRVRLDVPHLTQEHVSESVPTCAAMVLRYQGLEMAPDLLASLLRTDDLYGTPSRRLGTLRAWGVRSESPRELQAFRDGTLELNERLDTGPYRLVYRWEERWLRYVNAALQADEPPILFVDLGRLGATWRGLSQPHAVVLSGGDGRQAWIYDPARTYGPVRVGLGTLMDALLPGEPLAMLLRPDRLVRSLGRGPSEGTYEGE